MDNNETLGQDFEFFGEMYQRIGTEETPMDSSREINLEHESYVGKVYGFFHSFSQFITHSQTIEYGMGFVMGTLFTQLCTTFLSSILVPPIGLIFGNTLKNWFYVLKQGNTTGIVYKTLEEATSDGAVTENVGVFFEELFNFLAIGFLMFLIIKIYHTIKIEITEQLKEPFKVCPMCYENVKVEAKKCRYCHTIFKVLPG